MEENPDKIFTFPINFLHNPYLENLSAAAIGCYVRVILNYWLTGHPIPQADVKLIAMTRVNHLTWKWVKDQVKEALRITMPKIIKEREEQQRQYRYRLKRLQPSINALMKYNEAKRRDKANPLTDSDNIEMLSQPVKKHPYDADGWSDKHEIQRLRQQKKPKKPFIGGLKDK